MKTAETRVYSLHSSVRDQVVDSVRRHLRWKVDGLVWSINDGHEQMLLRDAVEQRIEEHNYEKTTERKKKIRV